MSRSRPPTARLLALLALIPCGGRAAAQMPSFHLVGFPPGTNSSRVQGLSADGRVAAGFSLSNVGTVAPGFTWTAPGGRLDWGLESGLPSITGGYAISGDGTTVVGESLTGAASSNRAFRWQGPGTFQNLGTLPFYERSAAYGVSGDGSVVVGRSSAGSGDIGAQAVRWTQAGGIQGLGWTQTNGAHSEALGVSRDGGTIVGYSQDAAGHSEAFVRTDAAGMQPLSQLPGASSYLAYGVNADGTIVVGYSGALRVATIWRNGQVSSLGTPAGWTDSLARAVDDNGGVVVGHFANGTLDQTAAVWTPDRGAEPLGNLLATFGASAPTGWGLIEGSSVSADGTVFGGWARSTSGQVQGFVATIPSPGSLFLLGVGLVWAGRRSRRCPKIA